MDRLRALWETVRGLPRLRQFLSLALLVLATGVGGYMLMGWSFREALYMTIITVTTVGYREVRPLSAVGEAFTMALILLGVGSAIYALTSFIQYVIEGHFDEGYRRRRMEQKIARLGDHYIVCGYGRVGRRVAEETHGAGRPVVVIDSDDEAIARAQADGCLFVQGDAARDEVLQHAGIPRAKALFAVTSRDEDNIYIVLSARVLQPDLQIIARANQEGAEEKLRRAGAHEVVSPYEMGGRRMAMLALRPLVTDYFDTLLQRRHGELQVEELLVRAGSALIGSTLEQLRARGTLSVSVLAVIKADGLLLSDPPPDTPLEEGDQLVVAGSRDALSALEIG